MVDFAYGRGYYTIYPNLPDTVRPASPRACVAVPVSVSAALYLPQPPRHRARGGGGVGGGVCACEVVAAAASASVGACCCGCVPLLFTARAAVSERPKLSLARTAAASGSAPAEVGADGAAQPLMSSEK